MAKGGTVEVVNSIFVALQLTVRTYQNGGILNTKKLRKVKYNKRKKVFNKDKKPAFLKGAVIKSACHICGGDINIHTPDCTSYSSGMQYGRQIVL